MSQQDRPTWTIRRPLWIGLLAIVALIAALGIWAALAEISGAVIGRGEIEVSSARTEVQHPVGGVVVDILRHEGDAVLAGEVILRLDDTGLLSDLTVTESELYETLANIARLEAALENRREMILHPLLAQAVKEDAQWQALLLRLQGQLDDHFTAIDTELQLLSEKIAQIAAQIEGIAAQRRAAEEKLALVTGELERAQSLGQQGLIRAAEVTDLESEAISLRGDLGKFEAETAELRGKITEAELERLAARGDAVEAIQTELSKMRPERTKLLETRSRLVADLALLDIRAPVSGRIIGSQVAGLRSVVVAAVPLMSIVPTDEPVVARIRVAATDVDQVHPGQNASLRFTAFNGRELPVILGRVEQISADSLQDTATLQFYYEVKVALLPKEVAKLGEQVLIPGMPVEAFLATESRTPISYVMRPIMVYLDRAFRDS